MELLNSGRPISRRVNHRSAGRRNAKTPFYFPLMWVAEIDMKDIIAFSVTAKILDELATHAILPPVIPSRLLSFTQRTLSIFLAFLVFASPVSGAQPAARDSRRATSPEFDALPLVRSRQNHLLVRAYINGKPAWLGVDSGAPVSAVATRPP